MKFTATIEIPKNCDRRIHLGNQSHNMGIFEDFGPIKDLIPVNDGKMPTAYGFLEGTHNPGENDEVDVLIFSNKDFKTEDKVEVSVFGMLVRQDGDQKVLAHDETLEITSLDDVDQSLKELIIDFHGYKSPIVSIENREAALTYIEKSKQG